MKGSGLVLGFFLAAVFFFSGSFGDNCAIRFLHGSSQVGKVDFVLDGTAVFSNVQYSNITKFSGVSCGSHQLSIQNSSSVIYMGSLELNSWSTVALYGATSVQTVVEQTASPGASTSSIAFVNVLSDPQNVTFSANFKNQNPTGSLNYLSTSPAYLPQPGAAQVTFFLSKANITVSPYLLAYVVYTVFLYGPADNAQALFVLTEDYRPGDIRFIQACPDCGRVNFTIQGVQQASLRFGSLSNFTDAGPGVVQIVASIPGGKTLTHTVSMDPDEKTTIALSGFISDGTAAFFDWIDDLDSLPLGQAQIRFVHLLPKLPPVTFTLSDATNQVVKINLAFGKTSDYYKISSNIAYYLRVVVNATNNRLRDPPVTLVPSSLVDGTYSLSSQYYTTFLIGANATDAELIVDDGANLAPVIPPLTISPTTLPDSDSGLSKGAIAAIVIFSVIGGLALIAGIVWFVFKRRNAYETVP